MLPLEQEKLVIIVVYFNNDDSNSVTVHTGGMLLPVQGVLCAGSCLLPTDDSRESLSAAS